MNIDSLQAKTIGYLRLPVGIGVIFIHSLGSHIDVQAIDFLALTGNDLYDLFRVIFSQILSTVASPFFFMVSGYFYFRNMEAFNKSTYLSKTINRVRSILIPYLVWNLLAFLAPIMTMIVKDGYHVAFEALKEFNLYEVFWVYKKWGYAISNNLFGAEMYLTGPRNIPLWFLRELFVMSIISPIIFLFVKKVRLVGLIILCLCYFTKTWVSIPGFNITAVFFFTLGAYFGIFKRNIVADLRKFKVLLYVLFVLVFLLDLITMGYTIQILFIHQLFKLVGLFTLILFTSYIVEKKNVWLKLSSPLVRASFVIYVAHSVSILGITQKVFYHFFQPISPFLLTIRYLAIILVTVYICVLLYVIMMRFIPRIGRVITGCR